VDLYEGWVRHRRFGDVVRSFRHRLYMTLSDGDEDGRRTLEMPPSLGVGFNPVRFHFRMEGDEVASGGDRSDKAQRVCAAKRLQCEFSHAGTQLETHRRGWPDGGLRDITVDDGGGSPGLGRASHEVDTETRLSGFYPSQQEHDTLLLEQTIQHVFRMQAT
jgi:hypothetical protein